MQSKKIHFIAIGGSVMHNLALTLQKQGYQITGSDDEIYEPSRSRLEKAGLLPAEMGWFPEKIDKSLEAIIVGMHARKDNPELIKARELEIPIYSYAEYVYLHSIDKHRVVIAGSHGKTTITAMVMHVLKYHGRNFDYLVGAMVDGFEYTVKLTEDAPLIIIEGDEYPAGPTAPKPKFSYYKHHIGLVSGVAWDHINIYETENDYVRQFEKFADATPKGGAIIYDSDDYLGNFLCEKERPDVANIPYQTHPYKVKNGQTFLISKEGKEIPVLVFGEHNMKNISGAKAVCERLFISESKFYEAIQSFKGASNRLETLAKNDNTHIFKDFAHAPSKVKATTKAVKSLYPERKLIACLELHTFSSLNKNFLPQYKGSLKYADLPVVYFNPKVVEHKKLPAISADDIKSAFDMPNLEVFEDSRKFADFLKSQNYANTSLLLMSSGNFDNLPLKQIAEELIFQ
ncbi:UDP-N-acetylmuramate--L-alanine ligase [Raineya orbicola]|jgi:UDP-N-acetylmuramate: L-alanyl-gamma-D-glutamyl-meso-diaminopimelate ligase|uniref:UDP-N-acetylmuramate-alanine ligase n=1 Tax=Raineya orbicola TaxID=2016530 RepID=A0A2N3IIR9_9BACT|nr:Mur ligase domain-containing protein [Raineya orbicola]PKQ70171.1 UDP-N-acetylmuramate-alanine ligase [Raineya orbicola]